MITDSFKNDLLFIHEKIKRQDSFAFSKFADGEYKILRNELVTNCDKWTFNPTKHEEEREMLIDSFLYAHPEYIIGISCPCCQPHRDVQWMRKVVNTSFITWANLFVNSNYDYFINSILPDINAWGNKITLVANEAGLGRQLPINVETYIPCAIGAFLHPDVHRHIDEMSEIALKENNQLFLFSCGPLGNILAHKLHIINKNNTYLDVGSTLNPWIVGKNRGYLLGGNTKTCTWS